MHFKIPFPGFRWQPYFHTKESENRKAALAKVHVRRKKENISEGICKAGLLGQVSAQRDLYRVFKKNPTGAAR